MALGLTLLSGCQQGEQDAPEPKTQTTQEAPQAASAPAAPKAPMVQVEQADPAGSAAPTTFAFAPAPVFSLGLSPGVVEDPVEALYYWRQVAGQKPALLLFSNDPFLRPIPPVLQEEALRFAQQAGEEELRRRGGLLASDPLLLPQMAVTAALEADFFSELIWVLPLMPEQEALSLDTMRDQLQKYGALSPEEAEALSFDGIEFRGTTHGVPFRAVSLQSLGALEGPALLHYDQSYFKPLYKNEIKTPLFPLILQSFSELRELGVPVGAVTISRSNIEGQIPLDSRFVTSVIATLFRQPDTLDQALPPNWDRRARALYLGNFFKKEEIRDLYLAMAQEAPQDASVQFALYQIARQFKEGVQALDYLDKAVAIDPVFALEYLSLAGIATEKGRPDQTLQMLTQGAAAFPENPFIPLQIVQFHLQHGHGKPALELIDALAQRTWSEIYHPGVPPALEQMRIAALEMAETPPQAMADPTSEPKPVDASGQ